MAAISWGTRYRDYLISLGIPSALATLYQTYVNRMTTFYSDVAETPELIKMLEANLKPILEIAVATYGLALNQAQTQAYIEANYPQYTPLSVLYSNVIVTDINANLVGSPAAADYYTALQAYRLGIAKVLTAATKYARHFAMISNIRSDGWGGQGMLEFVGSIGPAN